MRGSIKIATLKDIHVYIHWTFLLLVGWVLITSLIAGFTTMQFLWAIILLLGVIACILLHELGHVLIAAGYGIFSKSVIFLPIGGIGCIEKFPDSPKQELAISFAGPIVNILIAMSISAFLPSHVQFWGKDGFEGIVHKDNILSYLFVVNIFLAIFNLLPAFPLDGGRILRALLGFKFNYIKATALTTHVSKIIAWLLVAAGILLINPFIPIAGVFIIFLANTEENYLRINSLIKDIQLKDVLMYDYNSLDANMTVAEASNFILNNHSKYYILMEGAEPYGNIRRWEIIRAIADMNYNAKLKELKNKDLKFFDGNQTLEDVLGKMSADEEKIYPVLVNHQFSGIISFQHILEYLLIHQHKTTEYHRIRSLAGLL
ncbi:site-2 protease family protein [Chitinophagaceae bacterium LB-8]|uniref:Zinc metalloprotease n=1 Tax=Paraflavisolibacter caeni TaxID=2982496 RepID=A0A9X2XZI0_9BACT|nr:site-2 protease family protein [Paraflavisolibacter caeni]MCU7551567.1 site-2 protease family protein [Paraflavisolibacter caeni]